MPDHPLIDRYLSELAEALPPALVEELTDGLHETYQHHLDRGQNPDGAAAAALIEFGDAPTLITAFVREAPGRHTARTLLATGPIVGAIWAAALLTGQAWTWPIPLPARMAFGAVLLTVIAALVTAARAHNHYQRINRTACTAGVTLIALDAAILAAALLTAPDPNPILALAATASITRITLTAPHLPTLLAN